VLSDKVVSRARRIVVLYGAVAPHAPADEQDTLVQVGAVADTLAALGYAVERLPLGLNLGAAIRALSARRPELVFNLVESMAGSGRLIHLAPATLEEVRIPYTGAALSALYLSSNKLSTKRLMSLAGLPTPPWQEENQPPSGGWPGPWIVKSVWEHASIGMEDGAVVPSFAAAGPRINGSPDWFGEAYIEGREINLAVLGAPEGPLVLPAAEIRFDRYPRGKPRIVGYAAKWDQDSFEYQHTPRVFLDPQREDALLARLRQLALACWGLFGLQGYARVDFRLDEAGRPWVLEVNANPCLSPDAGFAAAAARAGIPYRELVGRIAADGFRRAAPAPSAW
jgi:D-alanine-D-alanine ligase